MMEQIQNFSYRVQRSRPAQLFSAAIPQNRVVRAALVALAIFVVYRVIQSLSERVTPGQSSPTVIPVSASDIEAMRLIDEGDAHYQKNELDLSLQKYQAAGALNPTDRDLQARVLLGQVDLCLWKSKGDQALEKLEIVIDQIGPSGPLMGKALFIRGKSHYCHNKLGDAIIDFERALQCNLPEVEQIVVKLSISRALCRKEKFEEALNNCREALKGVEIKDRLICYELMRLTDICQERPLEALEYTQAAHTLFPETSDDPYLKMNIFQQRGEIFSRLGRFHEALQDIQVAIDSLPTKSPECFKMALYEVQVFAYAGKGDKAAALESYQKVLECGPSTEIRNRIEAKIQSL